MYEPTLTPERIEESYDIADKVVSILGDPLGTARDAIALALQQVWAAEPLVQITGETITVAVGSYDGIVIKIPHNPIEDVTILAGNKLTRDNCASGIRLIRDLRHAIDERSRRRNTAAVQPNLPLDNIKAGML